MAADAWRQPAIMNMFKHLLILLFLYTPQVSSALSQDLSVEQGGWVTRDAKPIPNSDSIKSIGGLGGWLVVTPDNDWESKWNTPPETVPYFSEASVVKYGEQLTILTFYINPGIDRTGSIHLVCNIRITKPDGSQSVSAEDIDCAKGELKGNPRNVRMTSAVLKYIGEEGDLPGKWIVEVDLKDIVRNVTVPLKTYFNLENL